MAYTPTTWINGSAPAVSAANLNKIESGIVAALPLDGTSPMTGQLDVIAGTATTPSIALSTDVNTGIYWSGADKLAISEGGKGLSFDEFKMTICMGGMI